MQIDNDEKRLKEAYEKAAEELKAWLSTAGPSTSDTEAVRILLCITRCRSANLQTSGQTTRGKENQHVRELTAAYALRLGARQPLMTCRVQIVQCLLDLNILRSTGGGGGGGEGPSNGIGAGDEGVAESPFRKEGEPPERSSFRREGAGRGGVPGSRCGGEGTFLARARDQ